MLRFVLFTMSVFSLAVAAESLEAGVIYSIGFDQATYNVTSGSTFDVKVIFRETVSGGDPSKLSIGGNDGLFSAGVKLDYSVITGGIAGATVSSITLNDGAGFFDDTGANVNSFNNGLKTADLLGQSLNGTDGIEVAEFPALSGLYSIELATISFTASLTGGETTTLTLADLDSGFIDSVLADATQLDTVISFQGATIVNSGTAAVPEPSTFAALGFGAVAYWVRRRRQRA